MKKYRKVIVWILIIFAILSVYIFINNSKMENRIQKYNEKNFFYYKTIGDTENSITYLRKVVELKDNRIDEKKIKYVQPLITEYENEKNLEKIKELEDTQKKIKILLLILIITTILMGAFSFYVYKKNKEMNRLNKLLRNLSKMDYLTKIQNRRALEEYLDINWDLYKKNSMPISFAMIDIDYFKKYNDNYGHLEGDKALEDIAGCIKSSCRSLDFVARYGGEEFIIIMLNTDKEDAIDILRRIKKNVYHLNLEHKYSDISDRITLSIGITTAYSGGDKNYNEYIKKADDALYKAKQKGRNICVFLD